MESAATTAPTAGQGGSPNSAANLIAGLRTTVTTLRQSRWQRQYYPSDIKNAISFKFYPYTLEWCGRPVGSTSTVASTFANNQYLKYRSGRLWMPMSFLGTSPGTPVSGGDDVSFFGPFFARLLSNQPDGQAIAGFTPTVTLSVWVQFRGQK